MQTLVRRHPLFAFFALAYALAWVDWIPMIVRGEVVRPGALPTHFAGLLGPAVAALVVTGIVDGWSGIRAFLAQLGDRTSAVWIAFALASPFVVWAIAVAALAVTGARVPDLASFGVYPGLPVLPGLVVFGLVFAIDGLGEETGWRGFALPRLRARHSALVSTLLLAPLWAAWHLPMFWMNATMRSMSAPTIAGFLFGLTCGAIILTWLYLHGGVLSAALWHAGYNMVSATAAGQSTAAIVTTAVVLGAIVLVVGDLRARRAGTCSPLDAISAQRGRVSARSAST